MRDFLTETNENLVRLEHEVLELERAPTNGELLNSILRTVHTVKGTCGFFELPRLERVAHACESVLSLIRRLDHVCGELLGAGRELARHTTGESTLQARVDQINRIAASLDDTVRSARMQRIDDA